MRWRELSRAGIRCNVLMMPVIPGLTDAPAAIESVVRAARRAGAGAVWWRSLFLKPSAARRFIPFIKEHFPEVAGRIDEFYAPRGLCAARLRRTAGRDLRSDARKYGFKVDHRDRREPARAAAPALAPGTQLSLGVRASTY